METGNQKLSLWKRFQRAKVPHVYVLMSGLAILCAIGTWLLPAGEFDRVFSEELGRNVVVPGTFHSVANNPIGLFGICKALLKGFIDAADIVALVFFAYAAWYLVIKTGALHNAVGALLRTFNPSQQQYIIPASFLVFAASASVFGVYEECYGFLPFFVGLAIALGYDAIVGCATVGVVLAMGYCAATMNPFTVVLGQRIAELPLLSGSGFRILVAAVMFPFGAWYIMRYANKVKRNPTMSYVYGIDVGNLKMDHETLVETKFSPKDKLICLVCLVTIGFIVWGTTTRGWYVEEIPGAFMLMAIICGFIHGMNPNKMAQVFCEGFTEIAVAALLVGISRTILIILQEGHIIDTVTYYFSYPLSVFPSIIAAESMLLVQNLINFFIPSGTGQVSITMPIMAPVSDLLGISRQVAVLAFQFGDGLSNIFWPTGSITVICAICRIPIEKWYKFITPFFLMGVLLQAIFIATAVVFGV